MGNDKEEFTQEVLEKMDNDGSLQGTRHLKK